MNDADAKHDAALADLALIIDGLQNRVMALEEAVLVLQANEKKAAHKPK